MTDSKARLIIVMGVSGSGKSTIGAGIADALGVEFIDGDSLHPPANKEKMRAGTPLVDEDRWPWLAAVAAALKASADANGRVVGACSALKRAYRDYLTTSAGEPIRFVHLAGEKQTILDRMNKRQHEYMPSSLLDSQFETLEAPAPNENVLTLDIADSIDDLVAAAKADLE